MKTFKVTAGDLFVSEATGRFKLIEKEEKLSQDVAECLLTAFEADRDFGNKLTKISNFIPGVVPSELNDAVNRLRNYQERREDMPVEEKISSINAIDVLQIQTDVYYYLEVSNSNQQSFGKLLDDSILTDLSHLLPSDVNWYQN